MHPFKLREAVRVLRQGGVLAYPTEAVFGLGCDPLNPVAVQQLLRMKQRSVSKGLILIASDMSQIKPFIRLNEEIPADILASWPGAYTWILPANPDTPSWLTGSHSGIAVRVTRHPLCIELCRAFGGAIVSTSANRSGRPAARNALGVRLQDFHPQPNILYGATGGLDQPTPIRNGISGAAIRG